VLFSFDVQQGSYHPTSLDSSKEIAESYRKSIITDGKIWHSDHTAHYLTVYVIGVVYSKLSEGEVLNILRQHLFSHVIRLPSNDHKNLSVRGNDAYYTQIKGIPQGSILSPILCNYYYGNAENEVFGSDNQVHVLGLVDQKTLIIRLMDDYIVISIDP
jgi:hypothetical protein